MVQPFQYTQPTSELQPLVWKRLNGFVYFNMGKLDLILLIASGTVSTVALSVAVWCWRNALRQARRREGELPMFFWAVGMFAALIVSGLSLAYILIPILF